MISRSKGAEIRSAVPADRTRSSSAERLLPSRTGVPGHAFVADHTDFDAVVGLCSADHGDQAAFDEIDMRDQMTGLFQDLVHIETDEFKMGPKQINVGLRERRQKTIARTVW